MPKDVRRGSDGFEDVNAFFDSSPPSQSIRSVGRPSTVKKAVASGSSPAKTPRTPSRKGKGRMSDLGDDMDDIGANLVGDEEESPGLGASSCVYYTVADTQQRASRHHTTKLTFPA